MRSLLLPGRRGIGSLGGGMNGAYYPETYVAKSLMATLTDLELTSNLKVCLDAGEGDSYTSGQKWLDLSGNGEDFFVGADGSVTATDPTFNGVADSLTSSEYWSFDGGDYFRYDTTNPSWVDNLHKDNALWGFACWAYPAAGGLSHLFGTSANVTTNIGVVVALNSTNGNFGYNIHNGSGTASALHLGAMGITTSEWQFLAVSINEAGNTGFRMRNTSVTAIAAAYTSPSSSNATYTMELGSAGNGNVPIRNGSRMAMATVWEGVAPTAWQMEQIYNKTRRRYGV